MQTSRLQQLRNLVQAAKEKSPQAIFKYSDPEPLLIAACYYRKVRKQAYIDYMDVGLAIFSYCLEGYEGYDGYCNVHSWPDTCCCGAVHNDSGKVLRSHCDRCKGKGWSYGYEIQSLGSNLGIHYSWLEFAISTSIWLDVYGEYGSTKEKMDIREYIKPEYGGYKERKIYIEDAKYNCKCYFCKRQFTTTGQRLNSGVPFCCPCRPRYGRTHCIVLNKVENE